MFLIKKKEEVRCELLNYLGIDYEYLSAYGNQLSNHGSGELVLWPWLDLLVQRELSNQGWCMAVLVGGA